MQLQGHIPKRLSQLRYLQDLWLDHNQLDGTIPVELGNLANLKSLRLHGNMLKGYLPDKLKTIPDLSYDPMFICNAPDDEACAKINANLVSSVQSLKVSERSLLSQSSAPTPLIPLSKANDKESWTCLCNPGGILGTQNYSTDDNSFTDCDCLSDCPSCVAGQVLDPLMPDDGHCICVRPLLAVIKLLNVQLTNYTLSMERNFTRNFAASLNVSPTQVVPVARRGGNVIVDIYVFPFPKSTEYANMRAIEAILTQRNASSQGILQDPMLGSFSILRIENPLDTSYSYSSNSSGKGAYSKFYITAITLTITLAFIAVLVSIACFIQKHKVKNRSSLFSFEKDTSSSGFTNLISQGSSITDDFQVYDNSCFNSSRGCMRMASFKFNSKSETVPGTIVRRFSYAELVEATEQFSKFNIIGIGGSSSVYRGQLGDGRAVAVKKLETRNGPDADREFLIEVELLSRLHHFHLVPLIGYCIEFHRKELRRLLVYEYMPNGNLREHLDGTMGKEPLNWINRVRIALGAARGLEYLHEAAVPRVLHRDFKSSNILLDDKWRAKLADFGMAKTVTHNDHNGPSSSPARMLGTFGYFAPEYAMMGRASLKSDVFSFGVVLLELISGRHPLNMSLPKGQQSLVIWASPLLEDENKVLSEIVDPTLKNVFPVEGMLKMAQLARACLQMDSEARPTMTAAVHVLATLIPENARKSVSLPKNGAQIPLALPWYPDCSDYNFSREEDLDLDESSVPSENMNTPSAMTGSSFDPELEKILSQKWAAGNTLLLGLEEILSLQEDLKQGIVKDSSPVSAADYLKSLTSLTADNPVRRSSEEELLDLTEPRMESFWHPNVNSADLERERH
ncbi:receptor-like serine/threonine-protein kinase NCRK isoform X2 [Cryptomeria japonica]|uniref:receptor-like serine/threonine-protein kinase NCRK isoform X2 n=2 Tax=Cryptomeria japonica TaxID=3369 RepID=UPI0027DA0BE8|nr:receptor-like serine/threonine-protein kinase NCRK isoform X2 [Cryptomeria japonica]XP_057859288.2 receptor-like serine/threonine-protein kinase NCRK isoform X2 [Cryptomeria japonica]